MLGIARQIEVLYEHHKSVSQLNIISNSNCCVFINVIVHSDMASDLSMTVQLDTVYALIVLWKQCSDLQHHLEVKSAAEPSVTIKNCNEYLQLLTSG